MPSQRSGALFVVLCLAAEVARASPVDDFLAPAAGRPACTLEQAEALGSAASDRARFLALFRCSRERWTIALMEGTFPVPEPADPARYRLMATRDVVLPRGGRMDLASGSCVVGGAVEANLLIVAGVWGSKRRIARTTGLMHVFRVSTDREGFSQVDRADMTCYRDEP